MCMVVLLRAGIDQMGTGTTAYPSCPILPVDVAVRRRSNRLLPWRPSLAPVQNTNSGEVLLFYVFSQVTWQNLIVSHSPVQIAVRPRTNFAMFADVDCCTVSTINVMALLSSLPVAAAAAVL